MTDPYINLTKEDARSILLMPDEELPKLLEAAYTLRKKHKGNLVSIHLLTNARSGNCSQNCAYCAQSGQAKTDIATYELITSVKLLQDGYLVKEKEAGEALYRIKRNRFSDQEIVAFASEIQKLKKERDTPVCCSIGFLTKEQAMILKKPVWTESIII